MLDWRFLCRHSVGGTDLPAELDWRGTGAVGVVKDQVWIRETRGAPFSELVPGTPCSHCRTECHVYLEQSCTCELVSLTSLSLQSCEQVHV